MNTNELQSTAKRYLTTLSKDENQKLPFVKIQMYDYTNLFSSINSIIKVTNASILFMDNNPQQEQVSLINIYDTLDFIQHLTNNLCNEAEFLDKVNSVK